MAQRASSPAWALATQYIAQRRIAAHVGCSDDTHHGLFARGIDSTAALICTPGSWRCAFSTKPATSFIERRSRPTNSFFCRRWRRGVRREFSRPVQSSFDGLTEALWDERHRGSCEQAQSLRRSVFPSLGERTRTRDASMRQRPDLARFDWSAARRPGFYGVRRCTAALALPFVLLFLSAKIVRQTQREE